MGHQVYKVFDCTDMPEKLMQAFYNMYDHKHNDSMVFWVVGDSGEDGESRAVDKWLVENGANAEGFETVIIRYWW